MGNENNHQSNQYNESSHNAVSIAKSNEKLIKSNIITEKELQEYKAAHSRVESWINSIPPKYRYTKSAQNVMVVKKSNLAKVAPSVAEELCDDVGFLPNDMQQELSNQVINVFKDLSDADFKAKKWFEVKLSGEDGGKTDIVAALIVGSVINDDKVSIGIALMAEEWQEEKNVKILVEKWNRTDLQKYANYILYKQLSKAIEN